MAAVNEPGPGRIARTRAQVDALQGRAQRTLVWRIWERMLEVEFVDRSVALAGKAFVSFFPLVIVIASFVPDDVRRSIFTALTHRLGVEGDALATARQAFASSDEIRRATGYLGLLLTIFFATSFTTALQRVYLRVWRRPPAGKAGSYVRGPAWLGVAVANMAILGALRNALGDSLGFGLFAVLALSLSTAMWSFTAWYLLLGQARWRVLVPTGVVTCVTSLVYGVTAQLWMPETVIRNEEQFGMFGVALALVTWFSGASICVLLGACAGAVLAEDEGRIGRLVRGADDRLLVDGAEPPLPPPARDLRLRDAFSPSEAT